MALSEKEKQALVVKQVSLMNEVLKVKKILKDTNQTLKEIIFKPQGDIAQKYYERNQKWLKTIITVNERSIKIFEKWIVKFEEKSDQLSEERILLTSKFLEKQISWFESIEAQMANKVNIQKNLKQFPTTIKVIEKEMATIDKISYWRSFKQWFTRNIKVELEGELTSILSENDQIKTADVKNSPPAKITSEQAPTDIYEAIALEDSLRRSQKNGRLIAELLDEQEQLAQIQAQLTNKTTVFQSIKNWFTRNKVKPEEMTSNSSENKKESKQVVTMPKAIEKLKTKTSYWQSFKKLFTRNKKVNFDLLTNSNEIEKAEIENLKSEPLIPKKLWLTATEAVNESGLANNNAYNTQTNFDAKSDEEKRLVPAVVQQPSLDSKVVDDSDDEEYFDTENEEFVTDPSLTYNAPTNFNADTVPAAIVHPQSSFAPEPVNESSSQLSSDTESDEEKRLVAAVVQQPSLDSKVVDDSDDEEYFDTEDEEFVTDPSLTYNASTNFNADTVPATIVHPQSSFAPEPVNESSSQLSSDSETDAEVDTLMITNTNSKSTLKSQINSLPNQIVLEKVKNLTWKIQQKSENNTKISKEVTLKKEEDNILENLINEYKSNIMITFDKNSKKFKEAFVIDNQGNKKRIVINESKKIIALEQVFAKATKSLARSWNDSYVDIANKLEKEQSFANASKLKTHNEKKWIRYLGKI